MYTDANGIAKVEDDDEIAPIQVLLNALQDATSDALKTEQERINDLEYDTGWREPNLINFWEPSTFAPAYRKLGKQVFLRGRVVKTGGSATHIFTLPQEFRPSYALNFITRRSTGGAATAALYVPTSGEVQTDSIGIVNLTVNYLVD